MTTKVEINNFSNRHENGQRKMKFVAVFFLMLSSAAVAQDIPDPEGPVLLTVTGKIERTNGDGAALLDRSILMGIGWQTIETHTFWTKGIQSFSGVPLAPLLEALGAGDANTITAIAINDYRVVIPVSDAVEHNILLALDHNGNPMKIRDKGPIWVIYPLPKSEIPESEFNAKMIWQLDAVHIE